MIDKISDACDAISRILSITLVTVFTVTVLIQVFFRYVLNNSLSWPEELARFMLVWMTFIAAAPALKRGFHVGVDYFVDQFVPIPWMKISILAINQLIILGFLGIVFYHGLRQFVNAGDLISPALQISYRWVYLSLPIGAFMMGVQSLTNLLTLGRRI